MKQLHKIAWDVLTNKKTNLSVLTALDLALLSNQKIIFEVSVNEYLRITAAFAFVLDLPHVLVVPNGNFNADVEGFSSISNRLMEKLSFVASKNFKKTKIIIIVKNINVIKYNKIVQSISINSKTNYNKIINSLKLASFEKVSQVVSPGQFCLKGGIIDIYSPIYSRPVRLCLYDDNSSCQFYDLATGLTSSETINSIVLTEPTKKTAQISLNELSSRDFYLFDSPFIKKVENNFVFFPLNYLEMLKKTESIHYLDSIYFSAYQYKGFIIAPESYKKQNKTTAQQEDVALQKGDFVCHEDFGLGFLLGFGGDQDVDGEEFLKIKYEDAVVNLSVHNLNKLSFVSRETGGNIRLDSLSKKGLWLKRKKRIQTEVKTEVEHLVGFYSNKKNIYREPYVYGGPLEDVFLGAFEYQDTPDQAVVWAEISKDLEQTFPMYRLLCGDVGFGKTEIAFRAAFRVVINRKQVILMAPTSVLASQHFRVCVNRMKGVAIKTALLTRFNAMKEKTEIKNRWIQGDIDILIGTHAVLYDPVFIKHAGLFIIDEEHRFGVKDKEGILEGFSNKDVLLMSATPIPRSLNLSFSGLSDISTLGTPPVLRRPIQTFVNYFDDHLIKQAIDFELARSGQIFFVHNNIDSIRSIKSYLERVCPYLRIVIAHSKVKAKTLKERLFLFVNNKVDMLLCTSIIGSGIDIPNVNTIIINSAHRFGLGQLHQIRGRVGRSERQGYAYLLIPKGSRLTSVSRGRLKTIEQNVSLGSGYHIAKSDLKIRGGGLMFGYQQSGKKYDFGFEFYSKLVSKVLGDFSGFSNNFFVDNFVYSVSFLCCFPKNYIGSEFDRLRCYRVLNGLYDKNKVLTLKKSLIDRFGVLPDPVISLINMRLVVLLACKLNINTLVCKKGVLKFVFNNAFKQSVGLFKFLKDRVVVFGVNKYDFESLECVTVLRFSFNQDTKINSILILNLLEVLYGVCKKG